MTAPNPLAEAPIKTLFFRYYVPALISMLSSTAHQVINGFILGRQEGQEGLAAVGLYGPVVIVFVSFTIPIMIGGGILISKSLGASDYTKVQAVFQFSTTLVLLIGGCIAASAPLTSKYLGEFLAGKDNRSIVAYTTDYAFWQLVSLPFFFLWMIWGNFLRADNAPKASRNASILAAAVNILLDLLFIPGFGWGVEGASLATAIALFAGAAYLLVYILRKNTHFRFSSFRFSLRLDEWKEFWKAGLPSFASEIAFSAGLLLISQRLIPFGAAAISAFGLINYVSFILLRPFSAAMIASLPIINYNLGANTPGRAIATVRFALGFTLAMGFAVTLLSWVLPDLLFRYFQFPLSKDYQELFSEGVRGYFLLFLAAGPNYVLIAFLQSTGKTGLTVLISCLKGFLLVMAALWILPDQFGISGVWLSRSLPEILTLFLIGIYIYRSKQPSFRANIASNSSIKQTTK